MLVVAAHKNSQGLSSSLWTRDIRNVGRWIGPSGSDAGIVNVREVQTLSSTDVDTWFRSMWEPAVRKSGLHSEETRCVHNGACGPAPTSDFSFLLFLTEHWMVRDSPSFFLVAAEKMLAVVICVND